MKPRLTKAGIIGLEIAGLLTAILAAIGVYALWQVEQGVLSLNAFRPSLHFALNKSLPAGYAASIGGIKIYSDRSGEAVYHLFLDDVIVRHSHGAVSTHFPAIDMEIAKSDLWQGKFGIRNIFIEDARATVIGQTPEGLPSDPVAQEELQPVSPSEIFSSLTQTFLFRDILRTVEVQHIHIDFIDLKTDRSWYADNGSLSLHKEIGPDFQLEAQAGFNMDKEKANLAFHMHYDASRNEIGLNLSGRAMPLGDLAGLYYGIETSVFTAPVTGNVELAFQPDGTILKADFKVDAKGGNLVIAQQPLEIYQLDIKGAYNQQINSIELADLSFRIGESYGQISGRLGIDTKADFSNLFQEVKNLSQEVLSDEVQSLAVLFDVHGRDLSINSLGVFPSALPLDKLSAKGRYGVRNGILEVENINLTTDGIGIAGGLIFQQPQRNADGTEESFGLKAKLKTSGNIDHQHLLTLWPERLAPNSRNWVATRIKAGYATNLDFIMNLPPGMRSKMGYIPDECLNLKFDIGEATAEYILGLTPLSNAFGNAVLRGNSMLVKLARGQINSIQVKDGEVTFPKFNPSGQAIFIRFKADGQADEIVSLLDQPPLKLMEKAGIDPRQISGTANVDMMMHRPVRGKRPRGGFHYDGTARFSNLTFAEFFGGTDVRNADGVLDLKTRYMTVEGEADFGFTPVTISWRQNFYGEDGPAKFSVSGVFDSATGDLFGIPTRSFLRGAVDFSINVQGALRAIEKIQVITDFTNARLELAQLGWEKARNIPGTGQLDVSFTDQQTDVTSLILQGDGFDIQGQLSFNSTGRLLSAAFNQFFLENRADFSITAKRAENKALSISLSGKYLNLGPVIEHTFSQQAESINDLSSEEDREQVQEFNWGDGVIANLRLDRLGLRNDVILHDTALDLWRDADLLQVLKLSGLDKHQNPLSLSLFHGSSTERQERTIEAETADLGTLLEGLFAVTSIRGGSGTLSLDLPDKVGGPISGKAYARNLRVVEAPLLARVFAAGSLDGLSDLLNNEGIALDTASAEFTVYQGAIKFRDANAIGPSVGMTVEGQVGLNGRGAMDLSGALAPAYQVNSFLGNTPLIGDLFINREGEGLLALSYQVSGDTTAPAITINPLSALAPGVFRRIFEPQREDDRPDKIETLENQSTIAPSDNAPPPNQPEQ